MKKDNKEWVDSQLPYAHKIRQSAETIAGDLIARGWNLPEKSFAYNIRQIKESVDKLEASFNHKKYELGEY